MPDGSCFCGAIKYKYTGEVQAKALCHCRDCQKITGSTYSTNIIVPGEGFEVTSGKPKEFSKTADGGNKITSFFCGDCGSTLYREGPTFGDAKVVKVGTLDDTTSLDSAKPAIELYVTEKPSWVGSIVGADQKKGMPGSESVAPSGVAGIVGQVQGVVDQVVKTVSGS